MHQILIEQTRGEHVLESLREEWKALFAATSCSPFLSFEWLSTWYKFFGKNRTLFVLKAYRQNQLIGLFPLCFENKKILGLSLREIGFIGEGAGYADYLDLIANEDDKSAILSAVIDYLNKVKNFDILCLENLANDSASATFLSGFDPQQLKFRFRRTIRVTAICPQIHLLGNWETVLKQSRRSSNFKRRLKQLEKLPGFEFRSITSPLEITGAFERFYRLHEKRWEKSGGSDLSGHPRLVSFHFDLTRKLAEAGLIRFDELWIEGECRASVYGLDDRRAFYYYNAGYDLEWANRSVGLVLIGLSIKHAIERGNSFYDFLRGDEIYKFDWANSQSELVTITFSNNSIVAAMHEFNNNSLYKVKSFAKAALPSKAVEKVRILLRKWTRSHQLSNLEIEKAGKGV